MTFEKQSSVPLLRHIILPTSFSEGFIEGLIELNSQFEDRKVTEIYGSMQRGAFHSARPSKYLPLINEIQFKAHVRKALDFNIGFNYMLNSPSYVNYEYTSSGRRELADLLQFLSDCGVASVTVAAPYLVDIISSSFPDLEVVVSTIGYVNAKRGIDQFTAAGAKRIVLDVEVNRDFAFLKQVVSQAKADLEIVVNPVCLYQCHFKFNHYCTAAFGAQPHQSGCGRPYNQYYLNWCYLEKLKNAGEFMRSPWVRPEDLHLYQSLGLNHFKIAGRGLTDDELLQRGRYYLQGTFKGNLLALLGWPHWMQFRKTKDGQTLAPLDIILQNEFLDGFLAYFHDHQPNCRLGCEGCGHCDKWAAKYVKANDSKLLQEYIATMQANIRALVESIPTDKETEEAQQQWNTAAARQRIDQ